MNRIHEDFRRDAALAFLKTATDPRAPDHELTGSYSALREELKRIRPSGLGTLAKMKKPRSENGLERLVVSNGNWAFTVEGLNEYRPFLAEARRRLGLGR